MYVAPMEVANSFPYITSRRCGLAPVRLWPCIRPLRREQAEAFCTSSAMEAVEKQVSRIYGSSNWFPRMELGGSPVAENKSSRLLNE